MLRRVSAAAIAIAVIGPSALPHAQGTRSVTEMDLFKFTWIADPQISPDGSTVAFVRVTVNEKENRYETSLFSVGTAGAQPPRRLTSGSRDTTPRWSPDGRRILFVRAVEKDGKTQPPQLYLLEISGGEARVMTDVERGAAAPVWSPDGTSIAFTSATGPTEKKPEDGHKSDVQVVTKAVYRANGDPTYVDAAHHSHIFVMPVDGRATQITDSEFDEGGIEWARDGSAIYFRSVRVAEPSFTDAGAEIYRVARGGGAVTKIAAIDGDVSSMALSPDGTKIAFVGTERGKPIRSYSQPDLWVVDVPGSDPRGLTPKPRNLTANYDFDIAGGIGGDQAPPRGQNRKPIVWSPDGNDLLVVSAEHGSSNLLHVRLDGRITKLTDSKQDISAYSATAQGNRLAATFSTQTSIGDIFFLDYTPAGDANHHAPRQLTHVNDELFSGVQQSEPEEIWYRSFDGKQIQGWILKPPNFDASKKYPMILEIHGGPHSAYGNVYTHEFQWMAAKGYVVLFVNPRGSTTYGQEFGNLIQYHYPGDDYKDLMAGVDEVVKKGYVDANRLGVTGGSGGGLLTNWTVTQTQRFKAAVAQRDIADWYGFWFTADFTLFQPTWFRKAPWEDPQDFAARSPITHVANVTTPEMFILGDQDYRTPPADGGEMMFRALKYRKIPTVMVRFPRENHELSRSGEPWHRVERLQHIVGWMDQWLLGKKNTAYATQ